MIREIKYLRTRFVIIHKTRCINFNRFATLSATDSRTRSRQAREVTYTWRHLAGRNANRDVFLRQRHHFRPLAFALKISRFRPISRRTFALRKKKSRSHDRFVTSFSISHFQSISLFLSPSNRATSGSSSPPRSTWQGRLPANRHASRRGDRPIAVHRVLVSHDAPRAQRLVEEADNKWRGAALTVFPSSNVPVSGRPVREVVTPREEERGRGLSVGSPEADSIR